MNLKKINFFFFLLVVLSTLTFFYRFLQHKPDPAPPSEIPKKVTIAILGDSMVDTMGQDLPYLKKELQENFPHIEFTLLNYGDSSTDMDYGFFRMTNDYTYKDKTYKSILSLAPDILVIGSFAYNPFNLDIDEGLDHQWELFNQITTLATQNNIRIILLATIAPNKQKFGLGQNQAFWDNQTRLFHADKIEKYLQNTLKYVSASKLPLVNAYEQSLNFQDGNLKYISAQDHIHPSELGHQLIARLITEEISSLNWF